MKFIQGSVTKIPLEDKSIDVVVSFETIEHLDKHIEMLHEIKRVLMANGIFIISSPDKYYYSDIPNYKNEFHVKELYYEDFKKLIFDNFDKSFFFNQRTFGGSIIALDEDCDQYKRPLVVEQSGKSHLFTPVYNIALATNDLQFEIPNQIVLYTEQDQVITNVDIEEAKYLKANEIKKLNTWKVGHFVIYPFKLIKSITKGLGK